MTEDKNNRIMNDRQLTRVAGRLRSAMDLRGVTSVRSLARRAGVPEGDVWRILSGERPPSVSAIVGLARALGTSADYLLGSEAEDDVG